jgi:hypothetical protein
VLTDQQHVPLADEAAGEAARLPVAASAVAERRARARRRTRADMENSCQGGVDWLSEPILT